MSFFSKNTGPWFQAYQHKPWSLAKRTFRQKITQYTQLLDRLGKTFIILAVGWAFFALLVNSLILPRVDFSNPHFQQIIQIRLGLTIGIPVLFLICSFGLFLFSSIVKTWSYQLKLMDTYSLGEADKLAAKYPSFKPILMAWCCVGPLTGREKEILDELVKKDGWGQLKEDIPSYLKDFDTFSKKLGIDQEMIAIIRQKQNLNEKIKKSSNTLSKQKRL